MTDTTTTAVVEDQVATPAVKKTVRKRSAKGTSAKAKGTKGTKGAKTGKGAKGVKGTRKGTKDTKKSAPASRGNGEITANQAKILKFVAKKECTYGDIRNGTGIQRGLSKMVAAETKTGSKYPDSLEGRGLVVVTPYEGEGIWIKVTAKGKTLAKKL